MDELPDLKPVKITCMSKDCENDRHLYRPKRGEWREPSRGVCQGCGDTSVDMSIPRAKDANNPAAIFKELGREFIRDHFLSKPIDNRARRLIRRDGLDTIRARVAEVLDKCLRKPPDNFDGRRTSLEGNIIHYAQHATATCCRKCAWYWYGIPMDGEMSRRDLAFCVDMVQAYLDRREGEIRAIHGSPADADDK